MLSICVIIPTHNRKSYLKELLLQLLSQGCKEKINIIPLVVVDGSSDGTGEMLNLEFPSVKVLNGPGNWWWTKCINEGIKYSLSCFKPDYLLLLNDDSQIQTGYIDSLVKASQSAGNKAIIGSISVTDKVPHKVSFSGIREIDWIILKRKSYFKNFELLENIPSSGLFPTYALNGRGTMFKSDLLAELGLLNERSFPQYGSDDDLALRAWKKGFKVLLSYSSIIYDRTSETSKGTAFRQDPLPVFLKSFFTWNSVNYIPKQISFYYFHGIKILLPYYLLKFILGTGYAYFFKYKKLEL